ncbi:MAG: hypothetical protein ACK55Z_02205, partial [bacterium]
MRNSCPRLLLGKDPLGRKAEVTGLGLGHCGTQLLGEHVVGVRDTAIARHFLVNACALRCA